MGELLEAALEYAARGWRVFPLHTPGPDGCSCGDATCKASGKHPRLAHGVKEASADAKVVGAWWRRWPDANIGVATGPESGFFVLDLDRAKGAEASAVSALAELEDRHGRLPPTLSQRTGSGGNHRLYRWSAETPVKSRKRVLFCGEVAAAVDTRGVGGYIVAPPSLHETGRRYEWRTGETAVAEVVEAPRWLLDAITAIRVREQPPRPAAAPLPAPGAEADRAERYVRAALLGACRRLSGAAPGGRHDAMLREGRTLGGWAHLCPALGREVIVAQLVEAAIAAKVEPDRAQRTVEWAVDQGMAAPLDLPPAPERVERAPKAKAAPERVVDVGEDDDVGWLLDTQPDDYVPWGEDVVPEESAPSAADLEGYRPTVIVNMRDMLEVVEDARAVLRRLTGSTAVYARGGRMVRIADGLLVEVTPGALASALIRAARWVKLRPPKARELTAGEDFLEAPAEGLPQYLVPALLGEVDERLPVVERVARAPFFAGGDLVSRAGYHAASRSYLLSGGLTRGKDLGLGEAVAMLLGEWLGDFPFASAADRAHALAALLTPIMRAEIDGPVPLVMIEAPERRTGKTLLMELLTEVSAGQTPNPAGWAHDDEERRKTWSMLVRRGEAVINVDNVSGRMDDDPLCRILTSGRLMERLLGTQDAIDVPAQATWICTGNNALMSADLIGRSIRVRLDPRTDTPEARQDFQIADIKGWTRARMDVLRGALVELVEAWMRRGRPYSGQVLGKFEAWSRAVGGVLEVAGVPGFLGNRAEQAEHADPERGEWRALIELWISRGRAPMQAVEVARMAADAGLLLGVSGDGNELSRARRLGAALQQRRGRVTRVGERGWQIEAQRGAKGQPVWALTGDAQVHAFRAAE